MVLWELEPDEVVPTAEHDTDSLTATPGDRDHCDFDPTASPCFTPKQSLDH